LDPNTEAAATAEPNRPLSDYRVILDRNLFGSANTPASNSAREAAEIEAIGLAGNEVGLKLIGTAVGKDRRMNYAVLEVTKTRSQEILREKDMVGNVLIKRIFRNNVIILTASGEKRLSIDEKIAAGTAASPVQPSAAAMSFSGVPQVNPETKEMTHEISRSEITQSLPSLRQMLEESNSSANIREGKNDGFTIGRLRSRDAFFRIGLRTGDVIKSVDGEAVDNMDDAELLIDKLAEGGDFSILVERRGQLESLNLSIK
jgi:type II secretory pathway component PulC